jgi:hypothetical protein
MFPICILGGYDGASCLSSTERYDPLTGVWSCCPALVQRRRFCRLAALGTELPKVETGLELEFK